MPVAAVPMMEAPPAALKWVLAGGLTPEDAYENYGFRWHEEARRVLIPFEGGILGRAVHGERCKYRLYGSPGLYALPIAGDGDRAVVVVEDILSAIAVNRAGWPSVALLGTSVTGAMVARFAAPLVIVWTDDDNAGERCWWRLRKMLALWPSEVRRVASQKEPKHCHRSEIVARLEGRP